MGPKCSHYSLMSDTRPLQIDTIKAVQAQMVSLDQIVAAGKQVGCRQLRMRRVQHMGSALSC